MDISRQRPTTGRRREINDSRLDPVRLQNIIQSFGRSAALMSAAELGIFTATENGARTDGTAAAAADIHPVNAERLLIMLTAMELVHRIDGSAYASADDVDRF